MWYLIHRDCDLAWSAVNSHFILGIIGVSLAFPCCSTRTYVIFCKKLTRCHCFSQIGFVGMLWLRAYVMLLSSNASHKLVVAASTGTGAALCLMVSIVNRGVESGGGNSFDSYGNNILDLVSHYVSLLIHAATNKDSPGLLQLLAIALEIISLSLMFQVLLQESEYGFEERIDKDSCLGVNCNKEALRLSARELNKSNKCVELEDEKRVRKSSKEPLAQATEEEETRRTLDDSVDYSSVNVG